MSTELHPAPAAPESAPSTTTGDSVGQISVTAKRAIVVGASSGMGAALVRQLAAEGYRVAALARRGDKLAQLADDCAAAAAASGMNGGP